MARPNETENFSATDPLFKVHVPEPSLLEELKETVDPLKSLLVLDDDPWKPYRGKTTLDKIKISLFSIFPILDWSLKYKSKWLFGDIVGGLTIASLAVPQDLAYAKLARLPPVNGLYSSFVPPLIYAALGTSRHIAIGPVAVVSVLMGNLLTEFYDPKKQAQQYYNLAITATFFAGIFQAAMGLLRLGFFIDFLSHAAIVGFMGGAAIVGFMGGAAITIALQQIQGFFGISPFSPNTDLVSLGEYINENMQQFNAETLVIGISFLVYLVAVKILAWYFKTTPTIGKMMFYMNALGPLTCVIVGTVTVGATKAYEDGVRTVGKIATGVNPSSLSNFTLSGDDLTNAILVGLISGLIALTEAVAIARTFAALKGYHINGNQEMLALGAMNLCGSLSSCYVTTGSFSRSAVNVAAGGETMLTNIVMSLVVLITLVAITPLFKNLPNAALAAIIMNAVITLVDLPAAYQIWKTDKIDVIVMLGAFFGVLFISIEMGLLIALCISLLKVIAQVTRPRLATLGLILGANVYRNTQQYPEAETTPGIIVLRIDSPIYFPNANYIREKVLSIIGNIAESDRTKVTHVILDLTPVPDLDTTGIQSLGELYHILQKQHVQLGLANPARFVLRKLRASNFLKLIGEEWLFLSAGEAIKTCKLAAEKEASNLHPISLSGQV